MRAKRLLAAFFILAGAAHFLKTDIYMRVVPPSLPWHRALVLFSGAASLALGAGLLTPKYSRFAAWGLIVFLAAVFPSNIYMALHPEIFSNIPAWLFWARLPLQLVLAGWAFYYTK